MGDIAAGGGMRGGGGRRGRVSAADAEAQRKANAEAPRVENLLGRIAELFRPHRRALILTIALVLVGAGLTVVPPLLTQQAFDRGLFPPAVEASASGRRTSRRRSATGSWDPCASTCSATCRAWSSASSPARRRA
jgi:hypothetical protein